MLSHSRRIFSTTFARLQCSYSSSCILSEQHLCCLFHATAPTQLHPRFVILTALHSYHGSNTWIKLCKRSRRTHEMESQWGPAAATPASKLQHRDLRQLPWLMQHCVRAEGCSSTRCLGITFSAAQRGGQSCLNAESGSSPFVPNFPLVPSREGKIRYVPKKNVLRENFGRRCQTRLGRSEPGGPGLDGGPDQDGGLGRVGLGEGLGTCVFPHKNGRRNRLECSFEAVYHCEKPVFFTGHFQEVLDFPLYSQDFSRGRNDQKSGKFEGKIRHNDTYYRLVCHILRIFVM